jgi:hypothetical protein
MTATYQVTVLDKDGAEHEFHMDAREDDPLFVQDMELEAITRGIQIASVVCVEYQEEDDA